VRRIKHSLFVMAAISMGSAFQAYGASPVIKPYTLITMDYVVKDGVTHDTAKTITFHRSDGVIAEREYSPEEKDIRRQLRRIDFPDGTTVLVADDARTKSTVKDNKKSATTGNPSFKRDLDTCAYPGQLTDGQETLDGHKAIRIVSQINTGKTPAERLVEVMLPEFGCTLVSMQDQQRDESSGQWITTMGKRFVSIAPGEPVAAQFTGFDDYAEKNPTDLFRAILMAKGASPAECDKCIPTDDKGDQFYATHRP